MKKSRIFLVFLIALFAGISANAQELWLSAQGRANITKALRADVEVEHRSRDGFDATSRWSAEAALSYKCLPWLRAGVSYKFLYNRDGGKSTKKGNYIPAYWQTGHRVQVMATGAWKVGKFELSVREAYQFTRFPGQTVEKFSAAGFQKDDEIIEAESRHILRSRGQVEYKHKRRVSLLPLHRLRSTTTCRAASQLQRSAILSVPTSASTNTTRFRFSIALSTAHAAATPT